MDSPSWRQNLGRGGGFWRDGHWYDLHLEHRLPLALYRQLKAMERAGFQEVDCAWRQDDFFAVGGQTPE